MGYRLDFAQGDWELVGYQGVDAGAVIISDPCYVLDDDTKKYEAWLDDMDDAPPGKVSQPYGKDIVTIIPTTHGDGVYPIYVQRDHYGRPTAIVIDLAQELGGVYTEHCPYCGEEVREGWSCECDESWEEEE